MNIALGPNEQFMECDTCRAKPGSPVLCEGCLSNRRLIERLVIKARDHGRGGAAHNRSQSGSTPDPATNRFLAVRLTVLDEVVECSGASLDEIRANAHTSDVVVSSRPASTRVTKVWAKGAPMPRDPDLAAMAGDRTRRVLVSAAVGVGLALWGCAVGYVIVTGWPWAS